jgi:hypothetical protein
MKELNESQKKARLRSSAAIAIGNGGKASAGGGGERGSNTLTLHMLATNIVKKLEFMNS